MGGLAEHMPSSEFLLRRNKELGLMAGGVGQSAETRPVSDCFTTYTFDSRKVIQFHRGRGESTSADVQYTVGFALKGDS